MNKIEKNERTTKIGAIFLAIIILLVMFVIIKENKSNVEKTKMSYQEFQNNEIKSLNQDVVNKENQEKAIPEGPWINIGNGILKTDNGEIVEIGKTTYTTQQVLNKLGLPVNKEKYNGRWVVIGIEEGKLKLVSEDNVGDITIGTYDQTVNIKELQEVYPKGNFTFQKGMWSYSHAIEELNLAAQKATGISAARSIKIEDLEATDVLNITDAEKKRYDLDYGKTFKYYYEDGYIYSQNIEFDDIRIEDKHEIWSPKIGGNWKVFKNFDGTVINENCKDIVKIKYSYYNYNFTEEQKIKYANSLAKGEYWLASPCVVCKEDYAIFFLRRVHGGGNIQRTCYVIFLWICLQ